MRYSFNIKTFNGLRIVQQCVPFEELLSLPCETESMIFSDLILYMTNTYCVDITKVTLFTPWSPPGFAIFWAQLWEHIFHHYEETVGSVCGYILVSYITFPILVSYITFPILVSYITFAILVRYIPFPFWLVT